MDDSLKHATIEARARLIWGSPRSEVEEWLHAQGIPPDQVQAIIKTAWHERNVEIRKKGIRNIIIGVLSVLASVVMFTHEQHRAPWSSGHRRGYSWCLIIALFPFGVWRIASGIDQLICGAKVDGSVGEM